MVSMAAVGNCGSQADVGKLFAFHAPGDVIQHRLPDVERPNDALGSHGSGRRIYAVM
jgi:hypothetical protein